MRVFDPQNYPVFTWNYGNGHRVQVTDNQIPLSSGASAHVVLDVKHLIAHYSNQLCQNGKINPPIYMRAIEFVTKVTGTNIEVELSNIQANAYNYAPGAFTPSPVTPGPTATNCATTGATQTIYGQCGGGTYTGPTACPSTASCESQNGYYSQCLPTATGMMTSTSTTTTGACRPTQTEYGQCGGEGWGCSTVCPAGTTCQMQNEHYSQCLPA